jgi:hypothetical protein
VGERGRNDPHMNKKKKRKSWWESPEVG